MRVIFYAAAVFMLSANFTLAAPLTPVPAASNSQFTLVQEKKSETLTEKVKRTWRKLTTPSYTFCSRCLLPPSATACTEHAKTREEARSRCASRRPLCAVTDDMTGCSG